MGAKWIMAVTLATIALGQWASWYPPGGLIIPASPINATYFSAYLGGKTVYIAQEGLLFLGTGEEHGAIMQYLYSLCRYVAIDVKNATQIDDYTVLWAADVYCGNGTMWMPLRWLPLRFSAYVGAVQFVNAANATVLTPIGVFYNVMPAGWYYDPATKSVFQIPQHNYTLILQLGALYAQLSDLKKQLQTLSQNKTALESAVAQLSAKIAELERQRKLLEDALRARDAQIQSLQSALQAARNEAEAFRRQLESAKAENVALAEKIRAVNQTWASKVEQLQVELSQLRLQAAAEGESNGFNSLPFLVLALGGLLAALFVYRKKKAEE
ncbi:MAG: hypothetical protein OWQ51_12360 [Pyrobaculum arsenaticum]|uniref:Uncharacterized protein n=2 Tax=Pyrobaculum arsenaticum TaxID=121277 RepID=A4WKW2_PYRAR|nr:hypothetical protein [Pyrobaculum arsenaticum]ABP51029.1 conserved hypothetical protein [Pyrobaculum arsenaticum DSM 13514]MCY0891736.1 hypothetical protein [Pyrobaculum arsenaticum]NYR15246.1 hypothetical protein [Pyrobaculum arsenaticum]